MHRYGRVAIAVCVLGVAFGANAESAPRAMATPVAQEQQAHTGTGTVNSVDLRAGKANISHQPIASLGWPAMTMDFEVQDKQGLSRIKPGDKVEFKVTVPSKDRYVITDIEPAS